jgi:hypothetical protein
MTVTYGALYALLDSARDGADWREAVQILFGLDPDLIRASAISMRPIWPARAG